MTVGSSIIFSIRIVCIRVIYIYTPISEFGVAILRGMGWTGNDSTVKGHSRSNKKNGGNTITTTDNNDEEEEEMMKPRHHRLGLGATPIMMLSPCPQKINKNDNNKYNKNNDDNNNNSQEETKIKNSKEEQQSPPSEYQNQNQNQNKNTKESFYGLT